jgi:hypothetical protein
MGNYIVKLILILCIVLACIGSLSAQSVYDNLVTLSDGLVFKTEIDGNVSVVSLGRSQMLNADVLRAKLAIDPATPITDQSAESFFATVIGLDGSGRWENLISYMDDNLTNLRVYKVGVIRSDVFVVGLYRQQIIGIHFSIVQT